MDPLVDPLASGGAVRFYGSRWLRCGAVRCVMAAPASGFGRAAAARGCSWLVLMRPMSRHVGPYVAGRTVGPYVRWTGRRLLPLTGASSAKLRCLGCALAVSH